jgi:hypothetical protein
MSKPSLVAKERQPGSPFGLRQKQVKEAQKIKKYGANAPQLHPIRYSIEFYVMHCNKQAKSPKKYGANAPQLHHIFPA